jgi:hypothetical protein
VSGAESSFGFVLVKKIHGRLLQEKEKAYPLSTFLADRSSLADDVKS